MIVLVCVLFIVFDLLLSNFFLGLLPWFLYSQDPSEKSVTPDIDILEHFPSAERDGSRITWVCAVNTRDSLTRALESELWPQTAVSLLQLPQFLFNG